MAFGLLTLTPYLKRLAPAVVATMTFGFVTEASAMRYENQSGGRHHEYRGYDHRVGHKSSRSSVVIYRGPSYYEPRYGYGYRAPRYGYVNHRYGYRGHRYGRYAPRYRSYGYGGYRHGYGFGRGGVSFGFSGSGGDAVAILGLTALTLAILNSANERQRYAHNQALNRAASAPVGEPIIWNEANGSGRVTVTRTGTLPSTGQPCREFTQEVIIDGQRETAYGTACRQADGAWQLVR